MNRRLKLAILFAASAMVGHLALVLFVPYFLMGVAMDRIGQGGKLVNQFQFGPRITRDSRTIVRPSPDLAYATCVYDLKNGPLLIEAGQSPNQGYVSVSVFAANTDTIAVFDSAQQPQGIRFVLAREGQPVPDGVQVVRSPSNKGIVLDRRLAPTADLFAAVDQARRLDRCEPVSG